MNVNMAKRANKYTDDLGIRHKSGTTPGGRPYSVKRYPGFEAGRDSVVTVFTSPKGGYHERVAGGEKLRVTRDSYGISRDKKIKKSFTKPTKEKNW